MEGVKVKLHPLVLSTPGLPAVPSMPRRDAQCYWLDEVIERARVRHDQWLQSSPDQRAVLEPAYILGDRKLVGRLAQVHG